MRLYPYQEPSAGNLLRSLQESRIALDCSDTGTGKGIIGCCVAREVGGRVAVVCPKIICGLWQHNLQEFGVTPVFVLGYEKLRTGGTEWGKWDVKKWIWNLPEDTLIIWDEAHRCKSPTSQNARMLMAAKPYRNLLLSATLAQSPIDMRAVGYLIGLHNWTSYFKWCLRNGCWRGAFGGLEFKKSTAQKHLLALHEYIFPRFGSRLRIAELPEFPDCSITAETYRFDNAEQVDAAYDAANEEQRRREAAGEPSQGAILKMQARQKAEILKADGLAAMAADLIAEGNSVVIFTSFRETLEKLRAKLKCPGIYGGQNDAERQQAVDDFQTDTTRCIIVNIQAGGVGISLHDTNGTYPRVALLCPCDHAVDLKQALGRIWRSGAKSKAIQKIIFAEGTYESTICKRVQAKLHNIELLQDGDLTITEKTACAKPQVVLTSDPPKQMETAYAHDNPILAPTAVTAEVVGAVVVAPPSRVHARFSPSTLKSKAICPGYFSDPTGDSKFADRGILGHKAVEMNDPSLCGDDTQLRAAVEKCIAYKSRLIGRDWMPSVFQEVRLDYFDQYGFCDVLAILDDVADLADWKFAYNFYEADAPQFWAYSIGVWDAHLQVETINVHVVHPFRDEIDLHTFTRANDYERLSAQISAIIARARRNDPQDYQVSSQCAYCGMADRCALLANLGLEIARRYGSDLELPSGSLHGSEVTDPETVATLLRIAPIVDKAASGWKHRGLELWEQDGVAIPGFELGERRGSRSVASARAAFDVIKREVAPALKAEDYIDFCDIKATSVDEIVKSLAKRGDKAKAVEKINGLLIDEEVLSLGGGSRFLKPIRK